MVLWSSSPYVDTRARVVHKEASERSVKETSLDVRAWQLSEDAAIAAFRYLRAKGDTKGLTAECTQDAKSDGAIAVYELTRRYLRRYGALATDLDYKRLIRRAKRGVERFLTRERREVHESLDVPAHLTLEARALSLETSAMLHESLEEALGMSLAWPLSNDALQMLAIRIDARNRAKANQANARKPRYSARKTA